MAKVNISIPDDLLSDVDSEASLYHQNRSAFISLILSSYFVGKKKVSNLDCLSCFEREVKNESFI